MTIPFSALLIPYSILSLALGVVFFVVLWHVIKYSPLEATPLFVVLAMVMVMGVVLMVTNNAMATIDWSAPLIQLSDIVLPFTFE